MNHDQILAAAFKVQTLAPHLKPLDVRVLGAVIDGDLPLAYVRGKPELFGTLTAFMPAIDRLVAAGLVQRLEVAYPSTYKGKGTRPNRKEIVYVRTSKPIIDFIL